MHLDPRTHLLVRKCFQLSVVETHIRSLLHVFFGLIISSKTLSITNTMPRSRLCLRFISLLLFTSSFLMIHALTCRPDQVQALMKFKNEFDSPGCNRSDYLNGVQCDNATGTVTKLQLPSGCFTGILRPNSSLFELHHLRYLNLSHNNFTSSSLPSEFSNLNRLEVLSLASSSFTGQVPSSFSKLISLIHLNLSHNELTGSFPLVRTLTNLSVLDLSDNQFSGAIPSDYFSLCPSCLILV